jgi:hypothetical protein
MLDKIKKCPQQTKSLIIHKYGTTPQNTHSAIFFWWNCLGTDNKLGEDVVAECVKIQSFLLFLLFILFLYHFSYISFQTTLMWTQDLDFTVNFTLGRHWRRHWNSTGLEATPSGHLQHSITQDTGIHMTS